jgi:hypothetical protein
MAAKATTFSSDFLKLIFNATPIANLADNAASSPVTNLYVSLHTANPGAGGSQSTNEAAYTGYARQALIRNSSAWAITSNAVSPVSAINFPIASAGSETETYAAVGTASSGAGKLLWFGAISPTIAVTTGVIPQLGTSSTITET